MTCTKTGCHIKIAEYNEFAYGDAFEVNGVAIFRIVDRSHSGPMLSAIHYTVHRVDEWFDKDNPTANNSTLITGSFENHGYEGKAVDQ